VLYAMLKQICDHRYDGRMVFGVLHLEPHCKQVSMSFMVFGVIAHMNNDLCLL